MASPGSEAPLSGERQIYTVSMLNREVRLLLEQGIGSVWLEGEISNLARPASGHMYWSMKDAGAQIRCAMFRQNNRQLSFRPEDGLHVLARGRVSLYEPRGDYQLIVDTLEPAGEGLLRQRFEALKRKLAGEGLFAEELKRPLPGLPRRIGVVTSPTGAAVRDIISTLARRFPAIPVIIYPCTVQGGPAAGEIADALALAGARGECDVIILARGGGSLEDLWAFNEEAVARAIRACPIPVVTGVGHEVDYTIADFAADLRAPTPTGAAERVAPDWREYQRGLLDLRRRATAAAEHRLATLGRELLQLEQRLQRVHPEARLRRDAQRLDELERRLGSGAALLLGARHRRLDAAAARLARCSPAARVQADRHLAQTLGSRLAQAMQRRLEHSRHRLGVAGRALDTVSPLATLQRGYAIVTRARDGRILREAALVTPGETVVARLESGELEATVEQVRSGPEDAGRRRRKR